MMKVVGLMTRSHVVNLISVVVYTMQGGIF